MRTENVDVTNLQGLIGHEVSYDGNPCQVIEILEDGPSLVLQQQIQHTTIQADQHGEAHRRVPSTVTVPVLDSTQECWHPEFVSLQLHRFL